MMDDAPPRRKTKKTSSSSEDENDEDDEEDERTSWPGTMFVTHNKNVNISNVVSQKQQKREY